MPIIKQLNATKFRSLKYGNDTSDGGNSGQPYMKVELKDLNKPFNRLRLTKFDDGLIRGGAVGALNAAAVDTLRIGKFFKDLPKGPLFLIKQVGLQLSNPRLETKKGGGTLGSIGPTRLYNLGINTLAQVSLNAFGGHLMRHGLLPVMNESNKYLNVVTEKNKIANDNRLVSLRNKFDLGDGEVEYSITLKDAIRTNRQNNKDGRQATRELNRSGRQANRSLNETGRRLNREGNRDIRRFDREGRRLNREANRQGRQNNRLVNQNTREGARVEGFEFTRSRFERTSYEPSNLEKSKFDRSVFYRTNFKRNKLNISDYAVDSYLGGPGSVYGIGRTTINRYNFTEDKIKIDQAFENARSETIRGSLSFNPLTEQSRFTDVSGSYITGATTVPFVDLGIEVWGDYNKENEQFKALARNKQPKDFYYTGDISERKLQSAVGDGNINVYAQSSLLWLNTKVPKINPQTTASSDKFNVIKTQIKTDDDRRRFVDENPTYIGGQRIISVKQAGGDEINTTAQDGSNSPSQVIQQIKAKTQEEADALAQASMDKQVNTLNSLTVGRDAKRGPKTVKASIVNVKGIEQENQLRKIYDAQQMTSDPKTRINHKTAGKNFITQKVDINRDPKDPVTQEDTSLYFNGAKKVNRFERVDRDIMLVTFDPINPFDTTDLGTVVFSAYLSGFKYNSNSTWNPVKYVGRSESFYTFTEHKRDVSFNLQIPCFNRIHLLEKHRALSELQSVGAGKYNESNRLGGIITKITLGNYLVAEPGILTSISFDIPDVSSWDTDEKLAMYINAQFSFTIIGNVLPTYKEGGFLSYLENPLNGRGFLTGSEAR